MTVATVLAAIQNEADDALSAAAPTYPPESIMDGGPMIITVPASAKSFVHGDGDTELLEAWTLQVHFNRANADLGTVVAAAAPFFEDFITQCRNNPTLTAVVETVFAEEMEGTFGAMKYGDMDTLGWSIVIHTKRRI